MRDIIRIFRGDDTGGSFGRTVAVKLVFDDEIPAATLAECRATLELCGIVKELAAPLVSGETRTVEFTAAETGTMPLGAHYAKVRIYDPAGKVRTASNTIRAMVSLVVGEVYPAGGGDEITVEVAGDSVSWSDITGKPTTLAGYGITDAVKTVNNVAPDANGNVTVEAVSGGRAPEFVADMEYYEGDIVRRGGTVYRCNAHYSGDWNPAYFDATTLGAEIQERQRALSEVLTHHSNIARSYDSSDAPFAVGELRFFDTAPYPLLRRCIVAGNAETAEWEDVNIAEILADGGGGFTRKYVMVWGAESDEQMPTLMDFEAGRIVYDSGDDEQMPTAQELLGGDMVAELYMAGENRQGIEIYHDGVIIVKPYGGEMQVYEWSVVISEIMPEQTVLAKICAAVQGDSEKPILIVELS